MTQLHLSSEPGEMCLSEPTILPSAWSFPRPTSTVRGKSQFYDTYNRLATETDARGNVKSHSYEHARGLQLGTNYTSVDGTAVTSARSFSYNHLGQMLKAGVIDERGIRHEREEGTPQGGPLSPLLANVQLDDFDKELERRGHKFCRYADDCIIMVRTMAAAKRVLNSVTRYLENILKLKVNREKSKVVSASECPYLGYIIGAAGALRVGKEKVAKFKERIREITRRNRSRRLGETIEELNAYIRGWGNYYKLAALKGKAVALDKWIRRKLRVIKLKQCKRVYTIACFLRNEGVREKPILYGSGFRERVVATLQDARMPPSHGERVVQEAGVSLIAELCL